jgi:hypothetical protein
MAKFCNTAVQDAALNYIKSNAVGLSVCSTQPTTRAEAATTYMLASKVIASTDYTGPAAGTVSGRKLTVNAQNGISVTNSGSAQHIALYDASNLIYVTTCTAQSLTAGNTVNVPAWEIEIQAPS